MYEDVVFPDKLFTSCFLEDVVYFCFSWSTLQTLDAIVLYE